MTTPPPELENTYNDEFFDELADGVRTSAGTIVPIVVDLLHPASVLDVGCGRGDWLRAFLDHGVDNVVGVDGPHVPRDQLRIPEAAFVAADLREPLALNRRFDLVMSLEVAEHLDADLAPSFVASLVAHGRAVLFSAAIPFQGGAGHVNEAWQSSWAAVFAAHGFVPVDVIRPRVWHDDRVAFWYAQNTLLYIDERDSVLVGELGQEAGRAELLDVVHPALHTREHTSTPPPPPPPSLTRLLRELPAATRRAAQHRIGDRRRAQS